MSTSTSENASIARALFDLSSCERIPPSTQKVTNTETNN